MKNLIAAHLQARESDTPLVIDIPEGSPELPRIIAEIFILEDGALVFADIGWAVPDNPGHPFHVLNPPVRDAEPWQPGDDGYAIRELLTYTDGDSDEQWKEWKAVREELDATRERAREEVEERYGPTLPD